MKQANKLKSLLFGDTPIYLANNGRTTDQIVIHHDGLCFMVDIDVETGKPTGDFGWSSDASLTHILVREHYKTVKLISESNS